MHINTGTGIKKWNKGFPAIFSHSTRPNASVARVLGAPVLCLDLRPRISSIAEQELAALHVTIATVTLPPLVADRRVGRIGNKPISARSAYAFVFAARPEDRCAIATWKNYAPNRCRLFTWLAFRNRLFTNNRRFRHGMASSNTCPFCDELETTSHLLLNCHSFKLLWDNLLGRRHPEVEHIQDIWSNSSIDKVRSTGIIAILWSIWKRRNAMVFRAHDEDLYVTLRRSGEDLVFWANRCKNAVKQALLKDRGTMLYHLSARI